MQSGRIAKFQSSAKMALTEAAEILGISFDAASKLDQRAKKRLNELCGREGMIVFSWSVGSESSVFGVNPEGVEVQNTFVGDCPADLYL